jgi:nucleotide-binding universal stress UspA family protein
MSADIRPPARHPDTGTLRRVVVATDLSEASAGALGVAADLARMCAAELLIVHVLTDIEEPRSVKDTLGMDPGDLLERRAGEAEGRLRRLESMVGTGHAHAVVRCGSAAAEIVRLATEAAADLIVLGWHGSTGTRGPCAEPVAERVREHAPCPVIIALPPRGPSNAETGRSIHRVLVASDLTSRSDAAVKWGRALGERLGCPVHVLYVIGAGRRARRAKSASGRPDIIRIGDPAAQIVSCAHELGADLIVMGTRRRGVLRRALRRGVGRAVVERAVVPTMTAR